MNNLGKNNMYIHNIEPKILKNKYLHRYEAKKIGFKRHKKLNRINEWKPWTQM